MSDAPPTDRRAVRIAILSAMGLLAASLAVMVMMLFTNTGTIHKHGTAFRVPMPPGTIRLSSSDGNSTFLTFGNPDFNDVFVRRGAAFDWGSYRPDELMLIHSNSDPDLILLVLVQPKTRFFTWTHFQVIEHTPRVYF